MHPFYLQQPVHFSSASRFLLNFFKKHYRGQVSLEILKSGRSLFMFHKPKPPSRGNSEDGIVKMVIFKRSSTPFQEEKATIFLVEREPYIYLKFKETR